MLVLIEDLLELRLLHLEAAKVIVRLVPQHSVLVCARVDVLLDLGDNGQKLRRNVIQLVNDLATELLKATVLGQSFRHLFLGHLQSEPKYLVIPLDVRGQSLVDCPFWLYHDSFWGLL